MHIEIWDVGNGNCTYETLVVKNKALTKLLYDQITDVTKPSVET